MLKAYYFVCEKYSQPQERGGEKGSFKNCMLQARGNLLSTSIRHGITSSHIQPCTVFQKCHLVI